MTCPKCDGFGKVSSHNGATWRQFSFQPHNSYTELRSGIAVPITCPDCKGSGNVPDPAPEPPVDTPAPAKPEKKKSVSNHS